ncbi:hypothetical protein [Photobacterium indicum]|uniref:hypothetical protein n=1 Tax=Photobacterium indicum TaxID=81447 RepID=UPI003D0C20FA
MTNIIQIKNETNPYNHIFYGIEQQGESFPQIRINLAYLFYLRSLFHAPPENGGYEMMEEEILALYEKIFTCNCIIEPYSTLLESNSLTLSFVSAEYCVLAISNQMLKSFIKQRNNVNNDFKLIKTFILDDLKSRHPWVSLRPNTSQQDWDIERQRINALTFMLTL